jgi:hypothetical protein
MEAVIPIGPMTPSPFVRRSASAIILAHFLAIAVAVTSYSTPNYPAPQLAVMASRPLQPYLQATFLNNAYRFFAPNPGTPTHFWLRLQYQDGHVLWTELPGRPDSPLLRAGYQRRLNLALMLGAQLAPDPSRNGETRFTPLGETCLASVVRHVVHEHPRADSGDKPVPAASVGLYVAQHAVVTPHQVRDGWTPNDLRTYRAVFVGVFGADGEPKGAPRPILEQSMSQVVASILWADVHPRLRKQPADAVLEALRLPRPVNEFLERHPSLLDPSRPAEASRERVEQCIARGAP